MCTHAAMEALCTCCATSDLEVFLVTLVGVRVRDPRLHLLVIVGLLKLILHVQCLVAVDKLVAHRVAHAAA